MINKEKLDNKEYSSNKELEQENDFLYSQLYKNKKCFYCNNKAQGSHHNLKYLRSNKLYRWRKDNALPVCNFHHQEIHLRNIKELELQFENISLKDYLSRENISYREFILIKQSELLEELEKQGIIANEAPKIKKLSETEYYKKVQEFKRQKQKELYRLKKKLNNIKNIYI